MNSQHTAFKLLIIALIAFGSIFVFTLIKFALPGKEWTEIGSVRDFPPSEVPYPIRDPEGFLINLDGELLFLSNRPPHPRYHDGCPIFWEVERDRFQDPCGGATFGLDGQFLFGPSPRAMDSYALSVRGDIVWVETTTLIEGLPNPTGVP